MSRLLVPGVLIACISALSIWAVGLLPPRSDLQPEQRPAGLQATTDPSPQSGAVASQRLDRKTATAVADPGAIASGGSGASGRAGHDAAPAVDAAPERDPWDPGPAPRIPGDANPSVAAVVASSRAGSHPERFSAMLAPAPFDSAAFLAAPEDYLVIPEPGRVHQVAQPGSGVKRLRRISPVGLVAVQDQRVELVVQTEAEMPVTFTSSDLGYFDNQLTTITVQADAAGYARAGFIGTSGTYDDVDILAGSPVTSGQIRFTVHIELPGMATTVAADGEG